MTGQTFWIWVVICLAGWFAAVWLLAAWRDHNDDLANYRWPIDNDDTEVDR